LPLSWLAWLNLLSILSAPAAIAQGSMIEEKWSAAGLHGTLAKPASDNGRGPAVLIIAGSGPTDRDGNGPLVQSDTYRKIAEGLAANGIRSLRYDKRGIGESRALVTREEDIVFSNFVADAVTAVRDLAARPDVSAVIIAGHSEGALIGMLAAPQKDVAGLALLTATGRSMRAILTDQLKSKLPPALEAETYRILDALSAGQRASDVSKELYALFRPSVQPFLISVLAIDPAAELAKVKSPVLVMHAGRDLQIFPADFEALRKARPDATVVELPEANHMLKTSPADIAGNHALYRDRSAPLDPAVMPALVDFVRKVAPD
jgi:pimeloyl-ACP methyl ester carboxylesterase